MTNLYGLSQTRLNVIIKIVLYLTVSKWKFKMAFAIRRPPPPSPPLMAQISRHFFTPLFSFAIESYIYETDFTLQKYHFEVLL